MSCEMRTGLGVGLTRMGCSVNTDSWTAQDPCPELDSSAIEDDQVHIGVERPFKRDIGALFILDEHA